MVNIISMNMVCSAKNALINMACELTTIFLTSSRLFSWQFVGESGKEMARDGQITVHE